METILWFWGGMIHSIIHPDSSFFSLKVAGFEQLGALLVIILSNSLVMIIFYFFNRLGISLASNHSRRFSEKINHWSSAKIKKYGHFAIAAMALVPYLPFFRRSALLAGQLLGLRHTLIVIITCNALRVTAISLLFY